MLAPRTNVGLALLLLVGLGGCSSYEPYETERPGYFDSIIYSKELEQLRDMRTRGEACVNEHSVLVAINGDEYAASEGPVGSCMSLEEFQQDSSLANDLIEDLESIDAEAWQDKASEIVDLYCEAYADKILPIAYENKSLVVNRFEDRYGEGRQFAPNSVMPFYFGEATADWCHINPSRGY